VYVAAPATVTDPPEGTVLGGIAMWAAIKRATKPIGILAVPLFLVGAGCIDFGSSGSRKDPLPCVMSVQSGGPFGPGDPGGDGAGGGSGGAGGAGALGRFRGAIVSVRLADGELLGEAPVGEDGLVTVHACDYDGVVEVEVRGQPGAQYWDESLDAWVDFPQGQSIHAVLSAVTGHFGITPLTEAVYQYLSAGSLRVGDVSANEPTGKSPGRAKTVPTPDDIAAANRLIRDVINASVDAVWALDDPSGFLVSIGPETAAESVPANPAGRYALLVAAFAHQAKTFNPQVASPALAWSQQFGRDLSDGVLNGVDASGAPVAPAEDRVYDPPGFSQGLAQALGEASRKYGVVEVQPAPASVVGAWGVSADTSRVILLMADGRVEEGALNLDSDEPTLDLRLIASDVAAVFAPPLPSGGIFLRHGDGAVTAFGDNFSGELGTGDRSLRTDPVEIPALRGATEISLGERHTIARLADGTVLGMGSDFDCELATCGGQFVLGPTIIDLEGQAALSIATASATSFALMSDGRILSWGSEAAGEFQGRGLLGSGQVEVEGRAPDLVVRQDGSPLENVVSIDASLDVAFAIDSGGQIWGWGENFGGALGVPTEQLDFRPFAAPVPGVAPLRKFCGRVFQFADLQVALDRDGRLWGWGANRTQPALLPGFPAIRDCMSSALGVQVTAFDGARLLVGTDGEPGTPLY